MRAGFFGVGGCVLFVQGLGFIGILEWVVRECKMSVL